MERLYLTERLINADELIKHLDYVCTGAGLWSNILNDVIEDCKEFVNHELTVDAVPVVRCKDCKYGSPADDFLGGFKCDGFKDARFAGDWYCASGERKEGKNDVCSDHLPV